MAKSTSRLTVMDFIISVLTRQERELEVNLDKLEQIADKLEKKKSRTKPSFDSHASSILPPDMRKGQSRTVG
jgi:hypothetical protein